MAVRFQSFTCRPASFPVRLRSVGFLGRSAWLATVGSGRGAGAGDCCLQRFVFVVLGLCTIRACVPLFCRRGIGNALERWQYCIHLCGAATSRIRCRIPCHAGVWTFAALWLYTASSACVPILPLVRIYSSSLQWCVCVQWFWQCCTLVAGLLGIIVYKEIRGVKLITAWFFSACVLLSGAGMLGYFGSSAK